jgi:thioredoxin 1
MEISGKEIQEKIDNGEKLLLDFYGTWCGPCRMLKPIFEKVAKENTTDVQMYFVNVDENRDLAIKYGIRSIPAIKTFKGGEVTNSTLGVISEDSIKELVDLLVL